MKHIAIFALSLLFTGCCTTAHREMHSQRYVHVVMMWLKDPGNSANRQKIIDTSHSFVGKIPGLIKVSSGVVRPSTRPVVDSTYDVWLVMEFDSEEALEKYPAYPIHQKALNEVIKPLVEHYIVYDYQEVHP